MNLIVGSPITKVVIATFNKADNEIIFTQAVDVTTFDNFATNNLFITNTESVVITPFDGVDVEEEYIIFAALGQVDVDTQNAVPVVSVQVDDQTVVVTTNDASANFNAYLYEITSSILKVVEVASNEIDIRYVDDDPVELVLIELEEDV